MAATWWQNEWQRVRENYYTTTMLLGNGDDDHLNDMSDDDWEELGRDISKNTRLKTVLYRAGALNDHKLSFFFRGLTRSSSIRDIHLPENEISVAGVRSMVPFLQNANNLTDLYLHGNDIKSEGFNTLLRALRNNPIEELYCERCGIESIEIEDECFPKYLEQLHLQDNKINADGCRGLAKLLQGGDATLTHLYLSNNKIDDEGVEILVDALQNNTSLETLDLKSNDDISTRTYHVAKTGE